MRGFANCQPCVPIADISHQQFNILSQGCCPKSTPRRINCAASAIVGAGCGTFGPTFVLDYNDANNKWEYHGPSGIAGIDIDLYFSCSNPNFQARLVMGACDTTRNHNTADCGVAPPTAVIEFLAMPLCCPGAGTCTLDFTWTHEL